MELANSHRVAPKDPGAIDVDVLFSERFEEFPSNRSIVRADLEAARFARQVHAGEESSVVDRFLVLHDKFTEAIRDRVVPILHERRQTLESTIKHWATLYTTAVEALGRRHPRGTEPDLVWHSVNWSRELGVGAYGLAHIATASRYAELWAEQAVKAPCTRPDFDARLAFLDSEEHAAMSALQEAGELRVLGERRLGVPSFDLVERLRATEPDADMRMGLSQAGWCPCRLTPRAETVLADLLQKSFRPRMQFAVRTLANRALDAYLRAQGPIAIPARRFCVSAPGATAWAAFDGSSRLGACLLSDGRRDGNHWLIGSDREGATALLEHVKPQNEFMRMSCSPWLMHETQTAFPAQPMLHTPIYLAEPSLVHRGEPKDLTWIADQASLTMQGHRRASASIVSIDGRTSCVSDLEPGHDSKSGALLLTMIGRESLMHGRTVAYVGAPEARAKAAECEVRGFIQIGRAGTLSNWYFD